MSQISTPVPSPPLTKMETRILLLFTRTPLHVGAGASVGAIDQPVQRERHTGFPIIPGSTLKGVFADEWTVVGTKEEPDPEDKTKTRKVRVAQPLPDRNWLFGREAGAGELTAGALQFGEARIIAFPVRSARGSFAWLTCPQMLRRAVRDGVLKDRTGKAIKFEPSAFDKLTSRSGDEHAIFDKEGPLGLKAHQDAQAPMQVVLEEYTFTHAGELPPGLADALMSLLPDDDLWQEIDSRLVILSDGMMTFFANTSCEIAQHVRIDDVTGTADGGGLFNQENVPSDTLFYAALQAAPETGKQLTHANNSPREPRSPKSAIDIFWPQPNESRVFQFGADASTGLGYCTVRISCCSTPTNPE
jgi:CRISPR-associated protein Cmr4